jgi:dTDP-glucose pyrophosphorylase
VKASIRPLLIAPARSVKQAMARLDRGAQQILFVTDSRRRLLGTLTDGDIRRHILAGGSLAAPVSRVCNRRPRVVAQGRPLEEARDLMIRHRVRQVPEVDARGRIVGIVRWETVLGRASAGARAALGVPVVVMAGGRGSRLDPFTRILPKPLIPVDDRALVQVIMDRFLEFGCARFLLTVNYKAEMIRAFFDGLEPAGHYRIEYVREDRATGTAGSLRLLEGRIQGDFFLTNCDVLIKADYADILRFHRERKHVVTLVASVRHVRVPYGVVELDGAGAFRRVREKPELDLLANTGFYVIGADIARFFPRRTAFDMPELIARVRAQRGPVGVYPVRQGAWVDVGQWAEYLRHTVDGRMEGRP